MQFLVIAKDFENGGLERRMEYREAHVRMCDKLVKEKKYIFGVATLDEKGQMTGSVMVFDFPSRADLELYLEKEPYVVGQVWESVEITPCQPGPSFAKERSNHKRF